MALLKFLVLSASLWIYLPCAQAGQSFTVQGRLLNSDGTAVVAAAVQFKVQVRSPGAENCNLYEETQTLDLSQTQGAFALTIGSGTRSAMTIDGGNPLDMVFSNSASLSLAAAIGACSVGSFYTPTNSDSRKLSITFNEGSGWDSVPSIPLTWVPQAMYSQDAGKLSGINGSQFFSVASGTIPSALTAGTYTNLTNLLSVPSANYVLTSSSSIGTTTATDFTLKTNNLTRMTMTSAGNIGVGTTAPQATLDINGFVRLQKQTSQPVACDVAHDGSIALTSSTYRLCACKAGAFAPGLISNWYNSDNVNYRTAGSGTLAYSGIDGPINYPDFGSSRPAGVASVYFNARWTGAVLADTAGLYTFFTASDDGSRLYVNSSLIVDNWFDQAQTERSGNVMLPAGWHTITIEYYQGSGGAAFNVQWTPAGGVKALIPFDHLQSGPPNGWYFMEGGGVCSW